MRPCIIWAPRMMRYGFGVMVSLGIAAALATLAAQSAPPPWAFLSPTPNMPRETDDGMPKRMPGSAKAYTLTQIEDNFNAPDWSPEDHPPMPDIVAHGRPPRAFACAKCHMANGFGQPESASLAGLPAEYIVQQLADFKTGARTASGGAGALMGSIAEGATDADVQAAAAYFASIKRTPFVRVVEAESVPKSYVARAFMRLALPGGGTEPLGQRIIELPENEERSQARDGRSGYVAYVPVGSIKKGEVLFATGGATVVGGKIVAGRTTPCGICHGPDLKGIATIPGIAGRSPIYIVRQLYDIQHGIRNGFWSGLMKPVVANMTEEDMIAVAAYAASRTP